MYKGWTFLALAPRPQWIISICMHSLQYPVELAWCYKLLQVKNMYSYLTLRSLSLCRLCATPAVIRRTGCCAEGRCCLLQCCSAFLMQLPRINSKLCMLTSPSIWVPLNDMTRTCVIRQFKDRKRFTSLSPFRFFRVPTSTMTKESIQIRSIQNCNGAEGHSYCCPTSVQTPASRNIF
jgi:hypothetical protein